MIHVFIICIFIRAVPIVTHPRDFTHLRDCIPYENTTSM
jgi:hypothetical protein